MSAERAHTKRDATFADRILLQSSISWPCSSVWLQSAVVSATVMDMSSEGPNATADLGVPAFSCSVATYSLDKYEDLQGHIENNYAGTHLYQNDIIDSQIVLIVFCVLVRSPSCLSWHSLILPHRSPACSAQSSSSWRSTPLTPTRDGTALRWRLPLSSPPSESLPAPSALL